MILNYKLTIIIKQYKMAERTLKIVYLSIIVELVEKYKIILVYLILWVLHVYYIWQVSKLNAMPFIKV